jgi:hypothetical protein
MKDIQVNFGGECQNFALDFWFFGVDEDDVDIGGVAEERVIGPQGTGQVSRHQTRVR